MNVQLQPPAPIGSKEELRQHMAQHLALARVFLLHAEDLAEIENDEEFGKTINKHVTALRAVIATFNDLRGRP
jgi:hypothetical protein